MCIRDRYYISTYYPGYGWWSADPFTNFTLDKGYWFKVNESYATYNFTLTGSVPVAERTVSLEDGMNLVGWTSINTKNLWDAIPQTATDYNVTEVSERQPNGQYWISTFYPGNPPDYWWSADPFDSLKPGEGYWFKVTGAYTWVYTP